MLDTLVNRLVETHDTAALEGVASIPESLYCVLLTLYSGIEGRHSQHEIS